MVDVDAGVEDGHGRPCTVDPGGVCHVGPDRAQAAVEGEPLGDVDLHGLHVRRVPQAREVGGRHGSHEVRERGRVRVTVPTRRTEPATAVVLDNES